MTCVSRIQKSNGDPWPGCATYSFMRTSALTWTWCGKSCKTESRRFAQPLSELSPLVNAPILSTLDSDEGSLSRTLYVGRRGSIGGLICQKTPLLHLGVPSSLDWRQAHATFDDAVAGLAAELRGRRPEHFPHSAWELVEHIRLAQADVIAFMRDSSYKAPAWPDDYWPSDPVPLIAVRHMLGAWPAK